jgi:hypothetical protein
MVGIVVHGDNHFIVRGPCPDRSTALELVRHWSLIRIGQSTPATLREWRISSREYREDLQWAIVVPGDGAVSAAVQTLLNELAARGVRIYRSDLETWQGRPQSGIPLRAR